MRDEFYMLLSSDNSIKYFPDNNPSNFTVLLPYEVQLQGSWKTALVEIQYPQTLLHVPNRSENNWIRISTQKNVQLDNDIFTNYLRPPTNEINNERPEMGIDETDSDSSVKLVISHGNYDDIHDLINELNSLSYIKEHLIFEITARGFIKVTKKCRENVSHNIEMSEYIGKILGSTSKQPICVDSKKPNYIFNYPAAMKNGLPSMLHVYSDICEPYITGDSQTPLLRSFSLDNDTYNFGSNKSKEFVWLNYVPVQRTEFRTIEINIRDQHSNIIPFEYGTLTVALHFKKVYQ